MKKHITSCLKFIFTALLLLSLSIPAFCSGNALLMEQSYVVRRNEIGVFMGGEFTDSIPDAAQFSFTLGGETLDVKRVETTAELSVTYYCVVDISGLSQNSKQFNLEKEVLQEICDGMSAGDRMVIATVGETLTPSDIMSDKSTIAAYIRNLKGTGEHTNLYQGIVSALNDILTNEKTAGENETDRKCLIILSDGQDYYYDTLHENTSKSLADDAVRTSRIPVYTVAILNDSNKDDDPENWIWQMDLATILGTFAQESLSGVPYNPVNEKTTGTRVARRIIEDMKRDLLVTLDLSNFSTIKDIPELEVSFETDDNAVYRDSITVSAKDLMIEPVETDGPAEPDGSEEDNDGGDTTLISRLLRDPDFLWLRIAAPVILVLIAVLLALVLRSSRKKKKTQDSTEEPVVPVEATSVTMPVAPPAAAPVSPPDSNEFLRPVLFTALGKRVIRIELKLPENREVVLGRNQQADIILNPEDTRLSSRHCRVLLQGKTLRVWDEGSKNGTSVDGVPLNRNISILLEEGHTLWVGSYQYRVTFP